MKKHKISILYFKQSLIMTIVTLFLGLLSIFGNFGVLGIIIGIRTIIMWITQFKSFKKYSIMEDDNKFIISENKNHFELNKSDISYVFHKNKFTKELNIYLKKDSSLIKLNFINLQK